MDGWIKLWYIHVMKRNIAIKRNKVLILAAKSMNLENIVLGERVNDRHKNYFTEITQFISVKYPD